jgi:hypothetical protein
LGTEADITAEDKEMLETAEEFYPSQDENKLQQATMDHTDFQGEELNEESFGEDRIGNDLDVPGAIDETRTTSLGQGDEENKYYSLGGDENDSNENKS